MTRRLFRDHLLFLLFFFDVPATTEIYTLSLHDALPISFERLKEYLAKSENDESYAKVATALEMSEGAVGVAVFRMRKRFRGLLEEEIGRAHV